MAEVTQRPDEDIAEEGVAQVADVGGLVGIDVRVLDDDLAVLARPGRGLRKQSPRDVRTIDEEVEVPAAFDPRFPHASRKNGRRGDLGCDRPGRLANLFREVKRRGRREIPERNLRRPLQNDPLEANAVQRLHRLAKRPGEIFADRLERRPRNHGGRSILPR